MARITAWRVADPEFAKTAEEMMSGEGAFLYGGRWNSKGTHMVYLGSSLALAAMELLVHLGRSDVLMTFNKMPVHFDEALVMELDLGSLPDNWADATMASSVMETGNTWVQEGQSLLLKVPSVVIPGEFNYLFNPQHPDADQVLFGDITPFRFDPRLLK
ncbi:RES family NAD+ phosphorylase [Gallaecimonas sp. GXIMD4217]|uniref:RES family NAD+ phosphorylase n=1 Tax=Gallaecimonas sp. GXIMD4217 TaxID=3131927 RepID=UPI00311B3321